MRFTSTVLLAALIFSSCRTAPKAPTRIPVTEKEYKDLVEDQLGPLWYSLVKSNENFSILGTVSTSFEILAAGGRARNLKVTENNGGRMDEQIARSAIHKLRAPPIPPTILARLRQDYLVFEESFTIFDQTKPMTSPTPPRKR